MKNAPAEPLADLLHLFVTSEIIRKEILEQCMWRVFIFSFWSFVVENNN